MNRSNIPALTHRPDHVPPELVYDVDIFNLQAPGETVHDAWKRIQREAPPIF